MIPSTLFGLLTIASTALAAPLESRCGESICTLKHSDVIGFNQTAAPGIAGTIQLDHQPYLYVVSGCMPFPAVNAHGQTGGGLKPSGPMSGDCDKSVGQVYSRATMFNNRYAIMYAWYFPKDQTKNTYPDVASSHRHDWQDIIVWLSSEATDAKISGVSFSGLGVYVNGVPGVDLDSNHFKNAKPLVQYNNFDSKLHVVANTTDVGGQQPLVDWGQLTVEAQKGLNETDFSGIKVPFIDGVFENKLQAAWSSAF